MFTSIIFLLEVSVYFCQSRQLESISYAELDKKQDNRMSKLWTPKTPLRLLPDYRLMQLCNHEEFTRFTKVLRQLVINDHNINHFQWSTVSLASSRSLNRSYVLLGGSSKILPGSLGHSNVTPRDGGSVFLCEFEHAIQPQHTTDFTPRERACQKIQPPTKRDAPHEYLGASSSALPLGDDIILLVYCDPLWRATSPVPVGRCFLHKLKGGELGSVTILSEFCQSGLKVATPCMAGFSVSFALPSDLTRNYSVASLVKKVELWVGQPLAVPHGRVQIVKDPYGSATVMTIMRPEQDTSTLVGSQFGYVVKDGFITAPGTFDYLAANLSTAVAHLLGAQPSTDATQTDNLHVANIWFGGIQSHQLFSGFGTSMLRTRLTTSSDVAVVVGAPYSDTGSDAVNPKGASQEHGTGFNRGKIFLYCPPDELLGDPVSPGKVHLYNDELDGPSGSSHFGFSLSSLGDVDGDGVEDIAVGAPDLDGRDGKGKVYLVRLLPGCKFDPIPLQILQASSPSPTFGSVLPGLGADLDFNGSPDLVVPSTSVSQLEPTPDIHIFVSRHKLYAECRFTFPPWLSIRHIVAGDTIPIEITVRFENKAEKHPRADAMMRVFTDAVANRLHHQVIADWNASDVSTQRFIVSGEIHSAVDFAQNTLLVTFDLSAKEDVQDMAGIDTEENGLFVGYRFIQPCSGGGHVIDDNGTCSDGSGLKKAHIDWSRCIDRVPLSRFTCYPYRTCESDVSILISDITAKHVRPGQMEHTGTKESSEKSKIYDLVYGYVESSRPELLIQLINYGPTLAAGVSIEVQFHGDLRFAQLVAFASEKDFTEKKEVNLLVQVAANESWVSSFIGTLPAPVSSDPKHVTASMYLKLATYYVNYTQLTAANFTSGAGLTVRVVPGTYDPISEGNEARVDYRLVNEPKVRISYGPKSVFTRMDNRTKPVPWLVDILRRIDVEELGPRVEHSLQVEYVGPLSRLTNVTFRLTVPSELSPVDRESSLDAYIVYLFGQVRASVDGSTSLQWVDLWPKVSLSDMSESERMDKTRRCSIVNAQERVNPKKMIGMDVSKIYSRKRRHASINLDSPDNEPYEMDGQLNASVLSPATWDGDLSPSASRPTSSLFRRIPKEILQCDRVGYRLQKPICTEIICHVDELQRNRPVLVTVTGWLWARTMFDKHISDVDIVTTLTVDQGTVPPGVIPAAEPVGYFHLAQTFFFPQIRPKLLHQIPMWPIIVGVVSGILVLTLLIILLHELGFFKRRKSTLRKARYSKGGADELERVTEEGPVKKQKYSGFQSSPTDKYERGTKIRPKGKHRGDLTILHPADLAATKQNAQDEQKLLNDSPSGP